MKTTNRESEAKTEENKKCNHINDHYVRFQVYIDAQSDKLDNADQENIDIIKGLTRTLVDEHRECLDFLSESLMT